MAEEALSNGEDTPSARDSVLAAIESLQEQTEEAAEEVVAEEAEETAAEAAAEEPGSEQEPKEEPEAAETGEAEEEPEELKPILAPASWSKEDREHFAKLDRGAQAVVARRESERDKILNEAAREMAPLRAVVEENAAYFKQHGLSPDASFRFLLEADKTLRTGTPKQKFELYQQIGRDYGIEAPAMPLDQEVEELDPNLAALKSHLDERLGTSKASLHPVSRPKRTPRKRKRAGRRPRSFRS